MELAGDLLLLGVNHSTASVEERARCAVTSEHVAYRLKGLLEMTDVEEAYLLSTCNRTEVLASVSHATRPVTSIRQSMFSELSENAIYTHRGVAALFHVFRVASGMDSMVFGESEILGQMKSAVDSARINGALGRRLGSLLDQALSAGKRVRETTALGKGTLSVARAAVELSRKVLGDLSSATVTIIGAGETGLLVARHLMDFAPEGLTFLNRTMERAEAAARQFDGCARPMDDLVAALKESDLVVVSAAAPEPIIKTAHVEEARVGLRDRMPLLVDLSVPPGIDPALRDHSDLLLQNLDDLEAVIAQHRSSRLQEVEAVERILVEEVHKYLALQTYSRLQPVIFRLQDEFANVQDEFRSEGLVQSNNDEALMDRLCRRLLQRALKSLKEGTRDAFSPDQLETQYREHFRDA